jgi:hypothetical protein
MKKLLILGMVAFFFAACSSSSDDEEVKPPVTETEEYKAAKAYFDATLQPLIADKCVSCHAGYHNKSNTSNYGNITNAINNANGMFTLVDNGTMPFGGPALSQEEIDMFSDFLDLVNAIDQ